MRYKVELGFGYGTEVLWEDESLIIADKPSGIPVHETKDTNRPDFTRLLQNALGLKQLRTVNRLDFGTSGIVLLGKENSDNVFLDELLKTSDKEYIFVSHGIPDWETKRTESFLKEGKMRMMTVRSGGKKAITEFKVLEVLKKENLFLGQARLITGRRHQIRIHISEEGFPILGDEVYGDVKKGNPKRMFLHSWKFQFEDGSKNKISVQSSIPKEFSGYFPQLNERET
ncbi:RluA family pseudouridine synthase [Leptospira sp. 'Mane']|uniref:RluA family pseudouridine synthase n=1 Tax=Leptospira sp. 'Mane' TaxID=3387407 RepID=UPI00398AE4D1